MRDGGLKLKAIPKLLLDTEAILRKVDGIKECVGFPSSIRGYGYAMDRDYILVITGCDGFLRINRGNIRTVIEELEYLEEEQERRSRD